MDALWHVDGLAPKRVRHSMLLLNMYPPFYAGPADIVDVRSDSSTGPLYYVHYHDCAQLNSPQTHMPCLGLQTLQQWLCLHVAARITPSRSL